MFTGIVEELGEVVALDGDLEGGRLTIRAQLVTQDMTEGSSVAVNGVCLTVVELIDNTFTVDVMRETLSHSSIGDLRSGHGVNLERAVPATGRMGGHIVQGHVDDVGVVASRTPGRAWEVVRIKAPASLMPYLALKGSVAVDGVSLTVSDVSNEWFEVSLIPTTLRMTTLRNRGVGDRVNIEVDVIAKYLDRLLSDMGERAS